jgi:DNA primase large subunit
MICSDTVEEREAALEKILPYQQSDFEGLFEALEGNPVTIRFLDPPLHEFVPTEEEDIKKLAQQPRTIQLNTVYETNNIAQKQFQKAIEEYYILDKETKKDKRFKSKYNFTPPCIQYILENGATEGQRNITIACLTGFCKNSGKSLNETIDFISEWNSKNAKPTGDQEMKKTIKSIFMGEKLYGCSTLKLLSVCDESRCKLSKKKEGQNNVITSKSS